MIRSVQWSPLWGLDGALILALRWLWNIAPGRENLQKEGEINPGIHPIILSVILFSQLLIKLIGVRVEHEMNNNQNSDQ